RGPRRPRARRAGIGATGLPDRRRYRPGGARRSRRLRDRDARGRAGSRARLRAADMGALRSRFAPARLFPARSASAVHIRPHGDVSRTRQRTYRLRRERRRQRALGQLSFFEPMHTTACAERVSHLSVQGYIVRAATVPEGWPSGLRRTLGKRVYGKPYRGFESHSLRQIACSLLFASVHTWSPMFEILPSIWGLSATFSFTRVRIRPLTIAAYRLFKWGPQ